MTIYYLIGAVVLLWCFLLDKDRKIFTARGSLRNRDFDDAITLPLLLVCAWPLFMYIIVQVTIEEFE